jgi:hypothetical protein
MMLSIRQNVALKLSQLREIAPEPTQTNLLPNTQFNNPSTGTGRRTTLPAGRSDSPGRPKDSRRSISMSNYDSTVDHRDLTC